MPDAPSSISNAPGRPALADRLKQATHALHREAERTGFIGELLARRGSLSSYILFLRNLLPAYEALEAGLQAHARTGGPLQALARPGLYRSAALRADLGVLQPAWETEIPLLDAGRALADRIGASAEGVALAGHAYVRFLGDLNGGQILARLLARDLRIPETALRFYAFESDTPAAALATHYRAAIDALGSRSEADLAAVEVEAIASFKGAIALGKAVT